MTAFVPINPLQKTTFFLFRANHFSGSSVKPTKNTSLKHFLEGRFSILKFEFPLLFFCCSFVSSSSLIHAAMS